MLLFTHFKWVKGHCERLIPKGTPLFLHSKNCFSYKNSTSDHGNREKLIVHSVPVSSRLVLSRQRLYRNLPNLPDILRAKIQRLVSRSCGCVRSIPRHSWPFNCIDPNANASERFSLTHSLTLLCRAIYLLEQDKVVSVKYANIFIDFLYRRIVSTHERKNMAKLNSVHVLSLVIILYN